jgi:hypothetical protein
MTICSVNASLNCAAGGCDLADLKAPPRLEAGNFNDLLRQRYTSVAALNITARVIRLPEYLSTRTQIR